MRIAVPREIAPREHRVALAPDSVRKLIAMGHTVAIEGGAGVAAGYPDDSFAEAGAEVVDRSAVWGADVVVVVHRPDDAVLSAGTVLVGFLRPLEDPQAIAGLASAGVTCIPFELLPRTTLAQSMDALSSQANLAGYQAVLTGADRLRRILPMMTTAAGTIRPGAALVLGAGVAGLQAIATAKRLGAVVSAFDVRDVVAEQVQSLGAKFVELDAGGDASTEGGYAKELADDAQERIIRGLAPAVARSNLIITTAQIPGRPAPLLIDDAALAGCAPGTVVVDLAASSGGNTSATIADEEVDRNGVIVLGPTDLTSRVATDASTLLGRNATSLIGHLAPEGDFTFDFDDEIANGVVVTHGGELRSPRIADLLGGSQ
jgi:NAD(P) transhydrogenase subunit alpha